MVLMIVAVGWLYVVGLMAVAAVAGPQGNWLQGLLVLVFLGVFPLAVVLYIIATPARKRRLRRAQCDGRGVDGDPARQDQEAAGVAGDEPAGASTSADGSEKTR